MRFRKRPMEVVAHQWTPDDEERRDLLIARLTALRTGPRMLRGHGGILTFWCEKSRQILGVVPGSWIVEEPDGVGVYPITDEVLRATYEEVA